MPAEAVARVRRISGWHPQNGTFPAIFLPESGTILKFAEAECRYKGRWRRSEAVTFPDTARGVKQSILMVAFVL